MPESLSERVAALEQSPASRVWSKADVRGTNECWPWTASARSRDGRGRVRWFGRFTGAPRVMWAITFGVMPPSYVFVCHTCDNPECCNPAHLYLGDAKDNAMDCLSVGRQSNQRKTHCRRGHPYGPPVWSNVQNRHQRKCSECENALRRARRKGRRIVALGSRPTQTAEG